MGQRHHPALSSKSLSVRSAAGQEINLATSRGRKRADKSRRREAIRSRRTDLHFGVPHRFGEILVQKSLNTWVSKKALALTIFSPWSCRNHE